MTKIFISYSRVDRNEAVRLEKQLTYLNKRCWFDEKIPGGHHWWAEILTQIDNCDIFTFLLSPESVTSKYCLAEYMEASRLRKLILPLLIRQRTQIPKVLEDLQYVDLTEWTYESGNRVTYSLQILENQIPSSPLPPLTLAPTPLPRDASEIDSAKEFFIQQMRSSDNKLALAAVEKLRENRWLLDGSLRGANLASANLKNADLREANLSGVDLSNANIGNANLSRANFTNSILDNADFTGAVCSETLWVNVDLSPAIGLDNINHREISHIGIDTIYKSKGRIPILFLRGCGVQETLINYLPALLGISVEYVSCFISYSHADKSFARRVHDSLQGRGVRCWMDEHQLLPGDILFDKINSGIRIWDVVLLCCSESSLKSKWVEYEYRSALDKEKTFGETTGKKTTSLIPLDLDGYLFSQDYSNSIATILRTRLAANFQGWEHDNTVFERGIESLIHALQTSKGDDRP